MRGPFKLSDAAVRTALTNKLMEKMGFYEKGKEPIVEEPKAEEKKEEPKAEEKKEESLVEKIVKKVNKAKKEKK